MSSERIKGRLRKGATIASTVGLSGCTSEKVIDVLNNPYADDVAVTIFVVWTTALIATVAEADSPQSYNYCLLYLPSTVSATRPVANRNFTNLVGDSPR